MSFQLKEKKKISLLRKTLQIISHQSEMIGVHFARSHIRFFTQVDMATTCMFDVQAHWFSKFVPPEQVAQEAELRLQIQIERNSLLQSLLALDDTELDLTVCLQSAQTGVLRIIKTRDAYLVQCTVPFQVDSAITNDEEYIFPDEKLLLKANPDCFKPLKSCFKRASDQLTMKIDESKLQLKNNETNSEFEMNSSMLERFGVYLGQDQSEMSSNFEVNVSWGLIQSILKIAEQQGQSSGNAGEGGGPGANSNETRIRCAMETLSLDSALLFLATGTREWQVTISCGGVPWKPLDGQQNANNNTRMNNSNATNNNMINTQSMHHAHQSDHQNISTTFPPNHSQQASLAGNQMIKNEPNIMSNIKHSPNQQHLQVNQQQNSAITQQTNLNRTGGVQSVVVKESDTVAKIEERSVLGDNTNNDLIGAGEEAKQQQDIEEFQDEDARERQRRKENFYKEVDNEDFF